jgi:hypothetical protein
MAVAARISRVTMTSCATANASASPANPGRVARLRVPEPDGLARPSTAKPSPSSATACPRRSARTSRRSSNGSAEGRHRCPSRRFPHRVRSPVRRRPSRARAQRSSMRSAAGSMLTAACWPRPTGTPPGREPRGRTGGRVASRRARTRTRPPFGGDSGHGTRRFVPRATSRGQARSGRPRIAGATVC